MNPKTIVFDDNLWDMASARANSLIKKPIEFYFDADDRVVIRYVRGTKISEYDSWLEGKKAFFHHSRFVDSSQTVIEKTWICPKGIAVLFKLTFGGAE